jgi:hypothetical protein
MAIIYSYPENNNILPTDILVCTSTALINGKPKNQTKNISIADLTAFIALSGDNLNDILTNGNTSLLSADIGQLGLFDATAQNYGSLGLNGSAFNFSNASNVVTSTLTSDSLILYPNSYTGQLLVPNTITANRVYTFPDQSGIVALTSSLTGFVPYTGATSTVNLGVNDIDARWGLFNEVRLFDASYSTYGEIILQGESLFIKSSPTQVLANIDPGALGLLGYGPGGLLWEAKFTYTTLTTDRTYALPNATGTIALTSNLTGLVPYTGANQAVNLGANNLTANSFIKSGGTSFEYLKADGNVTTAGTLYTAISTTYQTAAGTLQSISTAIPLSIFTSGVSLLKLNAVITTTAATVAIATIEFYINSAATTVGATLIGRYNGPIGNQYIPIDRFFWVSAATLYGRDFTASASTSTSNSTFAINNTPIPGNPFYIIAQVTTTSTDRACISAFQIEKS